MKNHVTIFDCGRSFHLSLTKVVADDPPYQSVGRWLNGRVFGVYVDIMLSWWK